MSSQRRYTAEFLKRAQELFERALEVPAEQREPMLRDACGEDRELLEEALSLLKFDEGGLSKAALAIEAEAAEMGRTMEEAWIGRTIGVWRVTGILGKGGMGAVYEVVRDDGSFMQRAALKIVRGDMDSTEARRRFLEERQILATLDHPNIARLLDGGSTEGGQPYLVMEAVDGEHLLRYASERRLGLEERLRLAVTAIRAVQSAHQKLVVHRDLKPGNIFVTAGGMVKLLDFGIAKLLTPAAGEAATLPEQRWMTPEYASPEQVLGEPVGTASDIYSLGAVLYELVTGRRPLNLSEKTTLEAMQAVKNEQPPPPSAAAPPELRKRIQGDLDTVILKALHKEAARRYATAEQLAADLENFLEGRPVSARPDTFAYRTGKLLRRHALASAAVGLAAVTLVGAAVFSTIQARRAEKRFGQVRQLANKFLFDFHDSIKNLAGSLEARNLVAATALEYLDGLSAEARGDKKLLLELGAAYEKVGDVLGDRFGPNLGKAREALASYRKALALKLEAVGPDPQTPEEVASLVSAYYKMSDGLVSNGDTQGGGEMLERGLSLAKAKGRPQDKAGGFTRQGDLAARRGDNLGAYESYRNGIQAAEERHRQEKSLASLRQLAGAYGRLGFAAKMSSHDDAALTAFDRCIELNGKILKQLPNDSFAQRSLINAYHNRGDILRSPFTPKGIRSELSMIEYRRAQEIADRMLALEPRSYNSRMDALMSKLEIADTWRELEPRRGVVELTHAIADLDRLAADDPAFKDSQRMRALLSYALSDACARAGDRRLAERHLDDAIAFFQRVFNGDPKRLQMRRELAVAYADRGWLKLERGDLAGAARDAESCLPPASSIEVKKARSLDLRDTARCFDLAGTVALKRGETAQARQHYESAMARWREFQDRGLESAFLNAKRRAAEQRLASLSALEANQ